MTDEELSAIEKACAEATLGPWEFFRHGDCVSYRYKNNSGEFKGCCPVGAISADARLMEKSREWLGPLVAEVRSLREQVKRWEDKEVARASCCAAYEQDVEEVNRLLDEAGLHVGSSDLSTLVRQLIADAGRRPGR